MTAGTREEPSGIQWTALARGWARIKVPLPFSLKWVNSYIVPESDGYTVIDPGLRTDEALDTWEKALRALDMSWTDIRSVVLTHQHPDHYGLAGYMQERCGAPVRMTRRSHGYAQRLWGENSDYPAALRGLFLEHGMPSALMDDVAHNLGGFVARVSPQPTVTYMEAGETLELGGMEWELIDAPGHAFGAVCLYQRALRWMVCGDQVLPHITPNVSVVPGEESDPLAAFLGSLAELRAYDVELALPGHRDPFGGFRERIGELEAHHARRLRRMTELLRETPCSAFVLCEMLFGAQLRNNPHNLRFAMAETLAHLFHLEQSGKVTSARRAGVLVYGAAGNR